ncbi:MAG: hypothetical protein MUC98_03410 [Desulfobacterota bacterium]|jgi:hypothetical protein|nr:hypothetical protein [Thermodesulfobacteriota bacterium]
MGSNHTWKFFRAGGFDQVRLDTGADLMAIGELDQKLWVALACPTTGLDFDAKTLDLIDTDRDGRIRAPELIEAVQWAGARLKNPDDLVKGFPELPLKAMNESTPEGREVLASAKQILGSLGKPDATVITLEDTTDTAKIFAQTRFNGDGVIPVESTEEEATQAVLKDIIECLGSDMDRSGNPGVCQEKVDQFFSEAQAYSDWWTQAETDAAILPFGASTEAAAATFKSLRAKVDDYFTRCRLAAYDPRAANTLNPEEKEYLLFAAKDLRADSSEIAAFPLAQVGAGKPLPLREGLNPAWAGAMAKFETEMVKPLFQERTSLSEADWAAIVAKFAPYETWLEAKAGAAVEKLGLGRVREILGGNSRQTITELIARDKALEPEFNAIAGVERLVRYYCHLYNLMNNFVSFRDFYNHKDKAVFQAGTLYLDQRSCDLCLKVGDPAKHALMAGLSGTYLAYCDCVRKGSGEQMQVVAAFTNGDSDNLMVGRNGIFYDRQGRDWDATIAKIIDNPISIRQAFWSPYKKAVRMVQEQVAKRAAAADQAATDRLAKSMEKIGQTAAAGAPAPAEPAKKIDPGTIAALGVGAAGIGGMVGGFLTGFLNLKGLMPLGILAVILIISGPSMLMAWLKLRKRNLGPILDANGWAVNAKVRINMPFGASLTRIGVLPPGSHRDMIDPYAEKKRPWGWYIAIVIILLLALGWISGRFDHALSVVSPKITSSYILHNQPLPGLDQSAPKVEQKK